MSGSISDARWGWAPAEQLVVRRVTEDRWPDLRSLRLAALADSPTAFGSSLRREQEFDEDQWRAWSRSAAVFIASVDELPVAMAAGIAGDADVERKLVAVWVDPDWRGRGAASTLLSSVEQWAQADGAHRIRLWVTEGNDSARRIYQRRGYEATGRRKPLSSNPALYEEEMTLSLSATRTSPWPAG